MHRGFVSLITLAKIHIYHILPHSNCLFRSELVKAKESVRGEKSLKNKQTNKINHYLPSETHRNEDKAKLAISLQNGKKMSAEKKCVYKNCLMIIQINFTESSHEHLYAVYKERRKKERKEQTN